MRLKIRLSSNKKIFLPKGYIYLIQSFIYKNIINNKTEWLHENGYIHSSGKRFKLFSFSPILEKCRYDKKTGYFHFDNTISFLISSPVNWILEDFASSVILKDSVYLGKNQLWINSIEVLKTPDFNSLVKNNRLKIKTISPIEVHTTLDKVILKYKYIKDSDSLEKDQIINRDYEFNFKKNKQKKIKPILKETKKETYYFTPFEEEFSKRINENLKRKWEVFYKKKCKMNLNIKPLFSEKDYEKYPSKFKKVLYFGNKNFMTIINGWVGEFLLESNIDFIKFAYDVGLGSRNSQGFGLWEVIL